MKRVYFLILSLSILLVSCKKEDVNKGNCSKITFIDNNYEADEFVHTRFVELNTNGDTLRNISYNLFTSSNFNPYVNFCAKHSGDVFVKVVTAHSDLDSVFSIEKNTDYIIEIPPYIY